MELVLLGNSHLLYKSYFIYFSKGSCWTSFLSLSILFFKLQLLEFSKLKTGTPSSPWEGFESSPCSRVMANLLLLLWLFSFQRTAGHMMTSRPRWGDDVDKSI